MRGRVVAAILTVASAGPCLAAAPPQVVVCAACHGQTGMGNPGAGYPALAGLPAQYIEHQLAAFKHGTRKSPIMAPVAGTLTAPQRQALGVYFASLQLPVQADPNPMPGGMGAELAADGARDGKLTGVPACQSCHGPQGIGVGASFPRLAGQPATYLANQLVDWQQGSRNDDPLHLMRTVARQLKPAQIKAVTAYFAALPANPASLAQRAASAGGK